MIDLANLHFCRDDKVKYRKHLTVAATAATAIGFAGGAAGIVWMQAVGALVNLFATIIWIWE